MNILELISTLLPVSAASISLIGSIVGAVITSGLTRGLKKDNVHINNREIRLDGYNEEEIKEIIELLEKALSEKKQTQTDRLEKSSISESNND